MGCTSSTIEKHSKAKTISIPLNAAQKYLVRETWETVDSYRNQVGKKTFLRFFAENPTFQKLFPEFKDLEYAQLEEAKALHGHGKRVVKALENAVKSLDDAEAFTSYLEELGRRHVSRSLKPFYLEKMGDCLLITLRDTLKEEWTPETAGAWKSLYAYIAGTMLRGLGNVED